MSEQEQDSKYDIVGDILQNTNDGNDLSRFDLKMVENLINGFLNDEGFKYMQNLHKQVMSGTYKIPFFHGIENFIQDQEGFVYYKGKRVEHYSFRDYKDEEYALRDLERYCKLLEKYGIKPNGSSIWYSSEFQRLEKEGTIRFDIFLFKLKVVYPLRYLLTTPFHRIAFFLRY